MVLPLLDSHFPDFIRDNVVQGANGYLCRLCGTLIKQRRNLYRHFRNQHDTPVAYFCPKCQKRCNNKNTFQNHVYRTHPEWKGIKFDTFVAADQ